MCLVFALFHSFYLFFCLSGLPKVARIVKFTEECMFVAAGSVVLQWDLDQRRCVARYKGLPLYVCEV